MSAGLLEETSTTTGSNSTSTITPKSSTGLSQASSTTHHGSIDPEKANHKRRDDNGDIGGEQGEDANSKEPLEDDFPEDSLRAWLVLVGGTCNCFVTVGYVNCWGTFQAYYQETLLKHESPSTIAWIGSVQYSLIFLPGLIVGRLFDIGYFHSVFIPSSVLLVVATFLTAQCTEYWQFFLCQGIAIGLACGGIFGSRNAVLAHWFKKKRGRALGYTAMGSSISGTLLPIAARDLIPRVGFPWTMRIFGFIILVVVGICNLTSRRRLPPQKAKGGMLHLAAFKELPYTIYCISAFFNFLGLYTMLTYVNVSAANIGNNPGLAFYFVAFANAGSFFGRWTAGVLADMIGPLNITAPFTLAAGVLTYAWPFTHSTASLIVVTILYGFCSGTYVALLSAPVINLGKEGDVGRRIGMCMTFTAVGAILGPPISGAINNKTGGFEAVGLYAGSTVVVGVGFMLVARHLVLGNWTGKF